MKAPEVVRQGESARVVTKTAAELFQEGLGEDGKYAGGKWGGLYLRAPDIYFHVLEKAGDKLVRLSEVAEVRRGFTTGANDFFYLEVLPYRPVCPLCGRVHEEALVEEEEAVYWRRGERLPSGVLVAVRSEVGWEGYLEADVLLPLAKAIEELDGLPGYRLFLPATLTPHAEVYVAHGEKASLHERPTLKGRTEWWRLSPQRAPSVVLPAGVDKRYVFAFNKRGYLIDKRLYGVYPKEGVSEERLFAALDSDFFKLHMEISVRKGLGGGLADFTVYEYAMGLLPKPELLGEGGGWAEALGLSKREEEGVRAALEALITERVKTARSLAARR